MLKKTVTYGSFGLRPTANATDLASYISTNLLYQPSRALARSHLRYEKSALAGIFISVMRNTLLIVMEWLDNMFSSWAMTFARWTWNLEIKWRGRK